MLPVLMGMFGRRNLTQRKPPDCRCHQNRRCPSKPATRTCRFVDRGGGSAVVSQLRQAVQYHQIFENPNVGLPADQSRSSILVYALPSPNRKSQFRTLETTSERDAKISIHVINWAENWTSSRKL